MAFKFRQFSVEDQLSTMRVGTDSVLLGIWINTCDDSQILEIGTGCGVISLLIAQQSTAFIDAIEIDLQSSLQARQNFDQSPWKERLEVFHLPLSEYASSCRKKYDHIVSNPPFFRNSLKSPTPKRNSTRHETYLTYGDLTDQCSQLLNKTGRLSLILPFRESIEFTEIAEQQGLFLTRKLEIIPKSDKSVNRVLMEFTSASHGAVEVNQLTIRKTDQSYTDEYRTFTEAYYSSLR